MRNPLDPFSRVVDDQKHWDPEWYSWLQEIATSTTRLENAVPPETDLSGIQADIVTLQAQVAALQALSPPGLVFLSSQTITTPQPAINFTGLTSDYQCYLFEGTNLTFNQEGAAIFLRVSYNNGATYETTGYYYELIHGYQSAAPDNHAFQGAAANVAYCQITHGSSLGLAVHFTSRIYGAGSVIAQYPLFLSSSGNYNGTNGIMIIHSSGIHGTGSGFTGVQFLNHAGGNINTGTITMYGLRKT